MRLGGDRPLFASIRLHSLPVPHANLPPPPCKRCILSCLYLNLYALIVTNIVTVDSLRMISCTSKSISMAADDSFRSSFLRTPRVAALGFSSLHVMFSDHIAYYFNSTPLGRCNPTYCMHSTVSEISINEKPSMNVFYSSVSFMRMGMFHPKYLFSLPFLKHFFSS
jgi:hypothetical protein